MKKKYILIAAAVIAAFLILFLYPQMKDSSASKELLTAVGVNEDIDFYSMARVDWTNSAAYKSGYDLIAMDIDAADWTLPAGWNTEPATIEDITDTYGVVFKDVSAAEEMSIYDFTGEFDQWYFAETFGGTEEYPEHVFYIGLYRNGTLIIYRGSNLETDWVDIMLTE